MLRKLYQLCYLIKFSYYIFKVRDLLKERSTLKSEADAVAVLDGTQESAFQWV